LKHKIAILASGSGSNAEEIIDYFKDHQLIDVALIISNKLGAYVLERAKKHGIPSAVFSRESFYKSEEVVNLLVENKIDLIVLAGFLWLIPENLILHFPNQIVNIHPALLPKYGGKGMYGHHVHQAVFNNFEKESGMTIHYVNRQYDEGQIIFQAKIELNPTDTPDVIAKKVLVLEHKHYAPTIEKILLQKQNPKEASGN
jgi:phosphoribosylglycinamide formyltransferase-1